MNTDSFQMPDNRGILLTDKVDLDWLNKITPREHEEFVKFVVNTSTNQVVVGQGLHASATAFLGSDHDVLYGGNIFRDGSIEYQSTLNIEKNLQSSYYKNVQERKNPRFIEDPDLISIINKVLFNWILL